MIKLKCDTIDIKLPTLLSYKEIFCCLYSSNFFSVFMNLLVKICIKGYATHNKTLWTKDFFNSALSYVLFSKKSSLQCIHMHDHRNVKRLLFRINANKGLPAKGPFSPQIQSWSDQGLLSDKFLFSDKILLQKPTKIHAKGCSLKRVNP